MSLEVSRTIKKCILKANKVLRLSLSIEGIYFIFLEQEVKNYSTDEIERKRKILWNGEYEAVANVHFEHYKWACDTENYF